MAGGWGSVDGPRAAEGRTKVGHGKREGRRPVWPGGVSIKAAPVLAGMKGVGAGGFTAGRGPGENVTMAEGRQANAETPVQGLYGWYGYRQERTLACHCEWVACMLLKAE